MQKLLIVSARQFADKQEEMRTPAWLEWNSGEKFCNTFSCATPLESHVCVGTLQIIPTRDLHFRHFYQQPSSQSKGCCLSACHHAWRLKMLQSTSSKCVTCAVPSVIRQCGGRWWVCLTFSRWWSSELPANTLSDMWHLAICLQVASYLVMTANVIPLNAPILAS